jgi:membrane-associated phospholipid phosphatase
MIECYPSLLDSGVPTIEWIATHLRVSWLTPIIHAISDLGKEGQVIFTVAIAYWLWNKRFTTYLGYAMFTALLLNFLIKGWVMECRPPEKFWIDTVRNTFSFPSGHTQVATPLWLGFAYYVRNKWLAVMMLLIGIIIGLSRAYLGVHFVHDIVVGGILGIAIYAFYIMAERKDWQPLQKMSMATQTFLMLILLGTYILLLKEITPSAMKGVAALVGFWFGCQCESRLLQFNRPPTLLSALKLMIIGCIGIGVFWKGLSLLGENQTVIVIQYILLGWWITYGAPWFYTKLKRGRA